MNILLGLVFMILGIGVIAFSATLTEAFGRREWADRHLGGTTQGFVLGGFIIIIISVVIMMGGGKHMTTDVPQGLGTSSMTTTK